MVQATVPAPELALSEQPQSHIDASAFNRPSLVSIAPGLEQLGAGLEDVAGTAAKSQAQQDVKNTAVTLDANGVPQLATPGNSIILGRAGDDYHQAVVAGMSARLASSVSQHLTDMHLQFPTDPQGFKVAADAYGNALRDNPTYGAQVGNRLADLAANEGAQRYANISEKVVEIDTKESLQSVQAQISTAQNRMAAIARQGGTAAMASPEYQQLGATLQSAYGSLTGNKLFGYSQARADSELANAQSMTKGEAIVGDVDAAFKRTGGDGGRAGAQKMLQDKLYDPSLNLSIQERDGFQRQGLAHLKYLTSDQKAQIDASRAATGKVYGDIIVNKFDVPDVAINHAIAQAHSVGDSESVLKLQQAAAAYPAMRAMRGLSDEQRVQAAAGSHASASIGVGDGGSEQQAMAFFMGRGWSQAQSAGIVGNLLRESGLRTGANAPGDAADGSASFGLAQWNQGRLANLKTFAGQQGKSPTDFATQLAFVQRELETSEGAAATQLRAATTPQQQAAAAFALGYERPQGFLTGDIAEVSGGADRVAIAVRLAGGAASSAIVPSDAPSAAAMRGLMPAAVLAASRSPAGLPVPTPAQMAANPFALSVWSDMANTNAERDLAAGKAVGEALATQLAAGNVPPAATVAGFQQLATRYPGQLGAVAQKVNDAWNAGVVGGGALAMMTPAAAQSYGDQVRQQAQGADLATQARAQALQDFIKRGAENLKTDQNNEALRRGWIRQLPAPIDLSQPDTLQAALTQHAAAAQAIGAHTQDMATPMFAANEVPALKATMTNGTLDQRTALLGAITSSGAPEPVLRATLGQLASDKQTLPLAVAGSLARDNPQAARDILAGQMAMQTEPKLAPNKDDFPSEFAKVLPFNDLVPSQARQGLVAAIQATYAKKFAEAEDTTGILNVDRLRASIDAVTGGVVSYRGSKAIAPWYGAGQQGLDAALQTLTDADFRYARLAGGPAYRALSITSLFEDAVGGMVGYRPSAAQPPGYDARHPSMEVSTSFPASALKPSFGDAFRFNNWRLESSGDGKYLVFSGPDTARQYLGAVTPDGRPAGKFVLDLGAKRAEASRGMAGSASTTPFSDMPFAQLPVGGPM